MLLLQHKCRFDELLPSPAVQTDINDDTVSTSDDRAKKQSFQQEKPKI